MAHAHDASQNKPAKEVFHALIGIVLLLVIIAGIAIFAWLRPAGNHEPATVSATPAGRALDEFAQQQATAPANSQEAVAEASADDTNTETSTQQEVAETSAETTAEAESQAENPAQ